MGLRARVAITAASSPFPLRWFSAFLGQTAARCCAETAEKLRMEHLSAWFQTCLVSSTTASPAKQPLLSHARVKSDVMLLPPSHSAAYRGTSLQSCVCAGNETTALSEQYLNRSERLRGQNSVGNLIWHWFYCGNVKMARVLHNLLLFVIRLALKIRLLGFWSLIYGYCALCTVVALLKLWWNIILRPTTTFQWAIRETPPACLNDTSLGTHCYVRIKVRRTRTRLIMRGSGDQSIVCVRERKKMVVWDSLPYSWRCREKITGPIDEGGILLSAHFSVFKSLPDHLRWCWKNSSSASWLSLTASQWKHDAIPTLSASKISDSRSNRVDIYKLMSRVSHAKWRPWPHNCCHRRQGPLDRPKSLDVKA